MRIPYIRAAVLAVVALPVLAVSAPAAGLASAGAESCGYSQTCVSYAQSVPRVGTGTDVAVSCSAYTPYDVQATGVQCYIRGNTGDVHWTPTRWVQGPTATLQHTFDAWNLRSNVYTVCTGAGIIDAWYGDVYAPTNFQCGRAV